jgi:phosphate transport system permease protein
VTATTSKAAVQGRAPDPRGEGILRGSPRPGERLVEGLLLLAAMLSVLTTIGIVLSLLDGTLAFFRDVGVLEFLTGREWTPLFANGSYGVLPILNATLLITAIAMLVAIPLGLGAALYLSEYASNRARKLLKPILEVLAGVRPSSTASSRSASSRPLSCRACWDWNWGSSTLWPQAWSSAS